MEDYVAIQLKKSPGGRFVLCSFVSRERMKVIKSMTRVKNKSYVPKWKPPVEKDHTEDLDRQAKESLRKYEERKRLRRESGSDASHFLRSTSSSSIDFSSNNQEPDPRRLSIASVSSVISEVSEEPNVQSRNAISQWEKQLQEKQRRESLERTRLSQGKYKRTERKRTSSVCSNASASSVSSSNITSPSTNHYHQNKDIIRETGNVSSIRNRWRDMEKKNMFSNATKTARITPKRTKSFNVVEAGSTYRTFSAFNTSTQQKEPPVHKRLFSNASSNGSTPVNA